jgi:hypothetical protein
MIRNRNILFYNPSSIIWEGSHAILYKSYIDNFNKQMYDNSILCYAEWIQEPTLYWKKYCSGMGAWGVNGLQSLIEQAQDINEQAKLAHENISDIEEIVRMVKQKKIGYNIAYYITRYYISPETGYYLGPNKHTGTVAD